VQRAYTVKMPGGQEVTITKDKATVGTAAGSDIQLPASPSAAPQHAEISHKGRQVFLKPLLGEGMLDDSHTYLDGQPLRPHVSYVLGTGAKVAFGDQSAQYVFTFEENPSGGSPLMEMMVKGMAAKSAPEVKKMLDNSL